MNFVCHPFVTFKRPPAYDGEDGHGNFVCHGCDHGSCVALNSVVDISSKRIFSHTLPLSSLLFSSLSLVSGRHHYRIILSGGPSRRHDTPSFRRTFNVSISCMNSRKNNSYPYEGETEEMRPPEPLPIPIPDSTPTRSSYDYIPNPGVSPNRHLVLSTALDADFLSMGFQYAAFGMGCFWSPEETFWSSGLAYSTAVGYLGGWVRQPAYELVCTGTTGHAEVVRIVYREDKENKADEDEDDGEDGDVDVDVDGDGDGDGNPGDKKDHNHDHEKNGMSTYERLLELFWNHHDPTQMNRQNLDIGTQYRSAIFCFTEEQRRLAEKSRHARQTQLQAQASPKKIVTEIIDVRPEEFYFAEMYHQQYMSEYKNERQDEVEEFYKHYVERILGIDMLF